MCAKSHSHFFVQVLSDVHPVTFTLILFRCCQMCILLHSRLFCSGVVRCASCHTHTCFVQVLSDVHPVTFTLVLFRCCQMCILSHSHLFCSGVVRCHTHACVVQVRRTHSSRTDCTPAVDQGTSLCSPSSLSRLEPGTSVSRHHWQQMWRAPLGEPRCHTSPVIPLLKLTHRHASPVIPLLKLTHRHASPVIL